MPQRRTVNDSAQTATDDDLRARAVFDRGHFEETACLNCQTPLLGSYCHECGQEAHLHRTVGAFLHDLLHGALHLEGKTWRTLPELVVRPGRLTRRYIDGERRRFVSPMGLFLFSIFLMFAVFQALGITPPSEPTLDGGLDRARAAAQAEVAQAETALAAAPPDSAAYRAARRARDEALADLAELDELRDNVDISVNTDNTASNGTEFSGGLSEHALEKWRNNPGLMLYKLQSNSYKFSWLLIPLSLPFMWLLFFWKRRFGTYDHAVFVTYSLAFMSLYFTALSLAIKAGMPDGILLALFLAIPPLHIYRQLREAYALSRFSALWRLAALMTFITVTLALFAYLLVLVGSY